MIRVLIIDDSAFMRKKITDVLEKDRQFNVIGNARNGKEGLEKIEELKPDVITLDINMPEMDGLTCLAIISDKYDIPVVMLSSLTQKGELATFEALELGAVDFIAKPGGTISRNLDIIEDEIRFKIKAAYEAKNGKKVRPQKNRLQTIKTKSEKHFTQINYNNGFPIVLIGLSTGGPRTILDVLPMLPKDIGFSVVVVQHIPGGFSKSLAERIDKACKFKFKLAENKEELKPGVGYLAPGGMHLTVGKSRFDNKNLLTLSRYPASTSFIPSLDITFKSFAEYFKSRCLGVVMTGMGSDGTEGCKYIKNNGGMTVAEHEETCVVYGMPKSVIDCELADYICTSFEMAETILQICEKTKEVAYGNIG